eukprot:jgi/Tetstr1/422959/TSEL_013737.t1
MTARGGCRHSRRGVIAAAATLAFLAALVAPTEAWLCNGWGRRFCRGSALQVTGCPEPCMTKNCKNVKPTILKRRFGISVNWEKIALSGLWDNVYIEDDEICVATCYIDPLEATCRRRARYGGRRGCADLNCDHDDRTRYAGCHTDHRREPYHRPTCKECRAIFPGCEGDSDSELVAWEDTYWDANRDSSAVVDESAKAERMEKNDDDDDSDSNTTTDSDDDDSKDDSDDDSKDDSDDDSKDDSENESKEDDDDDSNDDAKADDDSSENEPDKSEEEESEEDESEEESGDKSDDKDDSDEAEKRRSSDDSEETDDSGNPEDDDGKRSKFAKGDRVSATGAGQAQLVKPGADEEADDYDYDYGEQDLELDIQEGMIVDEYFAGRDPFKSGSDSFVYASIQLSGIDGQTANNTFEGEEFAQHISAITGVDAGDVHMLGAESEWERMCGYANRNQDETNTTCGESHASAGLLSVSFMIIPRSMSTEDLNDKLQAAANNGDVQRMLYDAGYIYLPYSLDSAVVDRNGGQVLQPLSDGKGPDNAAIIGAVVGAIVAVVAVAIVLVVVVVRRRRDPAASGGASSEAGDVTKALPISSKTSFSSSVGTIHLEDASAGAEEANTIGSRM